MLGGGWAGLGFRARSVGGPPKCPTIRVARSVGWLVGWVGGWVGALVWCSRAQEREREQDGQPESGGPLWLSVKKT